MKLIDILVEELPKHGGWPEGATRARQSRFDTEIYITNKGNYVDHPNTKFNPGIRASDCQFHEGGVVTREQYEAALAAKNDGWIKWGGGLTPVDVRAIVDVKFNNGNIHTNQLAGGYSWEHEWADSNIIAYRLHHPQEAEQAKADDEADLNECIGMGPKKEYKLTDWINWGGGECPVPDDALVEVQFRNRTAFHVAKNSDANLLRWSQDGSDMDIIAYRMSMPSEKYAQFEASQVWNGEGLPPVGCECEYSLNGGKTWWNCKVDYIVGTQGVVMLCDTFEGVQYVQFSSYGNALKFRPTRSEAERKREKAVQALCNAGGGNGRVDEESGYGSCWFDVYEAIAAGKIPGVKLED